MCLLILFKWQLVSIRQKSQAEQQKLQNEQQKREEAENKVRILEERLEKKTREVGAWILYKTFHSSLFFNIFLIPLFSAVLYLSHGFMVFFIL